MRTIILSVCCAAGIVGVWQGGFAETLKSKPVHPALEAVKKKKGERNIARVTQMTTDCKLSADQQKAITGILKNDEEQKYAIIKDAADQMDKMNVQTEEKIVAELTQEQKQKYTGEAADTVKDDQAGLLKVFK